MADEIGSQLRVFLSHNRANKPYAERLAHALQLVGANVWFDSWKIRPGDSIVTAINDGLRNFDLFVLLWSANAASSKWVEQEVNAAFIGVMSDQTRRVIPVRMDDAVLPPLIQDRHYVRAGEDRAPILVAQEILGIKTQDELRLAVQAAIEDSGLEIREIYGVGVFVGCPKCGAHVDELQAGDMIDDAHDRRYAWARCPRCKWEDGGEI